MVRRPSRVTSHYIALHNHHYHHRRRGHQHVQQVRSSSDMTSSSFTPIVGCYQIELRRYALQLLTTQPIRLHFRSLTVPPPACSYTPDQSHLVITMDWMDCFSLADVTACLPSGAPVPSAFVPPPFTRILCLTPALFPRVIFPRYVVLSSSFSGAGGRQCVCPWPGCATQEAAGE